MDHFELISEYAPTGDQPQAIDQLVKGPMSAEAIQDASMAFKKALIERALGAELGHHLGYPQGAERPEESTNQRNQINSIT